jgi:thiosulfate/3-mercaptopyruvate sulfurtransferase
MAEYAHPEVLVSTEWVAEHGSDPNVRIVESDCITRAIFPEP